MLFVCYEVGDVYSCNVDVDNGYGSFFFSFAKFSPKHNLLHYKTFLPVKCSQ